MSNKLAKRSGIIGEGYASLGRSFVNNLFGSIAGSSSLARISAGVQFVPTDSEGGTLYLNGKAQWLGLRNKLMQKWAYEFCYPVSSVIDAMAKLDINGKPEIKRVGGKGKNAIATSTFAKDLSRLLARPNPKQSWWQFRAQQVAYKKIFGYCPVLPILRAGFEGQPETAIVMINLPPWLFDPVESRNTNPFSSNIDDVDPGYRISVLGKNIMLKASQLIILKETFMEDESTNFQLPLSPLVGLDWVVSNICKAMEADNVLLSNKGPLGLFSHDAPSDAAGYEPMGDDEKKELQDALAMYGLSHEQYQYIISRSPIRWVPTSFDVAGLGTKETILQCEKATCHRLHYPYVVYEQTEAAYANDNAVATVYQDEIIPGNDRDMGEYNRFFRTDENNCVLGCSYEHVGTLQEDKKQAADVQSVNTKTLLDQYANNLITKNQVLEALGYDPVTDGDSFKSEGADPLAVKLGVGGTTALTGILANPALGPETKKQCLIILFGLTEEDAGKLTKEEPKEEEPAPEVPFVDKPIIE